MKKVDVVTAVTINRPVEEVAEFAANPDNATKWYVNIRSVEWKTPRPLQLGSRLAFTARFLGSNLAYVYEVVEHIRNHKFVMRTVNGPFPMETTYEWMQTESNATRMTLRNRGTPSGFFKIFAPIMERQMRKANQKDLERLKQVLEK